MNDIYPLEITLKNILENTTITEIVDSNTSNHSINDNLFDMLQVDENNVTIYFMSKSDAYEIEIKSMNYSRTIFYLNPTNVERIPDVCCFTEGTQIMYNLNGDTKNIEDFEVGDDVVSFNVDTHENYIAKVKKLIVHENTTDLAEITTEDGNIVTFNAYHPFYTKEGWKSLTGYNGYEMLTEDDELLKTTGEFVKIVEIRRWISQPIVTYNLAIADIGEYPDNDTNDSFYANGLLAHNTAPCVQ